MREMMKLSIAALSVAAGLAACSGKGSTDAAKQDDFTRDLQLASSTTMNLAGAKVNPSLLNSLETKPQGAPQAAKTVKKGAGNRAVRSNTPTVRATPELDVAAVDDHSEQVDVVTAAPAAETEPVAVAPRPSPVPVVLQGGDGGGDYGTSGNGGGVFGGGGGIGGVVIRGGGVDGDHCEIHGTGRGGRMPGPIYMPNPGTSIPRTGGGIFGPSGTSRRGGGGSISRTQPVSRPSGIGVSRRGH